MKDFMYAGLIDFIEFLLHIYSYFNLDVLSFIYLIIIALVLIYFSFKLNKLFIKFYKEF